MGTFGDAMQKVAYMSSHEAAYSHFRPSASFNADMYPHISTHFIILRFSVRYDKGLWRMEGGS